MTRSDAVQILHTGEAARAGRCTEQERDKRRQSWLERHLVSAYEQLERAQWSSSFWKCIAFGGWAVAIGTIIGQMM